MIKYLRGWLTKRAENVPVWVVLGPENGPVEAVMLAADDVGVVLRRDDRVGAYPWHAIYRIELRA